MKGIHEAVLGKLAARLPVPAGVDLSVARWIDTPIEDDAVLQKGKVTCSTLIQRDVSAAVISHGARIVLTISGRADPAEGIRGAAPQAISAAFAALALSLSEFTPVLQGDIDSYWIAEHIFGPTRGARDVDTFCAAFGGIRQYALDPDVFGEAPGRDAVLRVIGSEFCCNADIALPLSARLTTEMLGLFDSHASILISEPIFRALTSTHWEHRFLEMYRAIEFLYAVPYIEDLRRALGGQLDHATLSTAISDHTGWRPKEEAALTKLLARLEPENLRALGGAIDTLSGGGAVKPDRVASKVYELRNSIAHLRAFSAPRNSPDWDSLIVAMCRGVMDLHEKLCPPLFNLNEKAPPPRSLLRSLQQAVRQRAYELWQRAGAPSGKHLHFWLEAKRELGITFEV